MPFAALHEPAIGPTRTSGDVRFRAAVFATQLSNSAYELTSLRPESDQDRAASKYIAMGQTWTLARALNQRLRSLLSAEYDIVALNGYLSETQSNG